MPLDRSAKLYLYLSVWYSIICKFNRFNLNLHEQLQFKWIFLTQHHKQLLKKLQLHVETCVGTKHSKYRRLKIKFQKTRKTSCWLAHNLNTTCDVPFSVSPVVKCLFIYKIKAIHCVELFPYVLLQHGLPLRVTDKAARSQAASPEWETRCLTRLC